MSCVLVTGGAGYIGSHTVVELLDKGYEVVVMDNLSNSHAEVLSSIKRITKKEFHFKQIDLCDRDNLAHVCSEFNIDVVIHFAAFKSVNESVLHPYSYYRNNLDSLLNLLDACKLNSINNIVFSSSCSVYGQPEKLPVNESAPLRRAESPYAYTKQVCERILEDISAVNQIRTVALRYFNPAGAHHTAMIGEYPLCPPNNLVPVITQTAIGKRKGLQVFGTDYDTPDGTPVRDYIHVVDIAKAHVVAVERLVQKKASNNFEIFNLGSGRGNTVLEIINTFEKVTGEKLQYTLESRRAGDVEKVYADTSFANNVLGWKAEETLESILDSAWKWEKAMDIVKVK